MSQNRSSAVMQQRAATPADALEYFPTPPWAARALCEFLQHDRGQSLGDLSCWEPACGEVHMARPLREYFGHVRATDVARYTPDHGICDFLLEGAPWPPVDWVVTNPPFLLGTAFIERALDRARSGVAMLVRSAFTEGKGRHAALFSRCPPAVVLQFSERVVMLQGRLIREGAPDPFNLDDGGRPKKASTATSYCWLVWQRSPLGGCWASDTRHRWIAPCRATLERAGDYPAYPEQWATIPPIPKPSYFERTEHA